MTAAGVVSNRAAAEPPAGGSVAAMQDTLELAVRVDHGNFSLDVDLHLPAEGVTAIFGPSGCGKTTLLRAVSGLARPRPGRVAVAGDVWQDDRARIWRPTHRRPLGLVFQDAALFEHLTVRGNLVFGRERVPAAERRVALEQAIELLGIGHLLERRPAQLSGGERQRVGIARALATSPRLLLMDEPLASLDAARKAELLPWFERLVRELDIPMLYVTHSVDEVARLADRLVLLDAGRVRAQGCTAELLGRLDIARTHGDGASVVIAGTCAQAPDADRLLSVHFGAGVLHCVPPSGALPRQPGDPVRVRILARDVSLTLTRARDTSILNVLAADVVDLAEDGPAQVLVALDAGGTRLLARITRKSARALQLTPGLPVYAQIKGVAVFD